MRLSAHAAPHAGLRTSGADIRNTESMWNLGIEHQQFQNFIDGTRLIDYTARWCVVRVIFGDSG